MRPLLLVTLCLVLTSCSPRPPGAGPTLRALYSLPPVEAIDPGRTALLLVDFQEEFFSGKLALPTAPAARARAIELLGWARARGVTVVHVRNVARPGAAVFAPGSPTTAFTTGLTPHGEEVVVTKPTGGGFTKTDLDQRLREVGVDTLVVAGIMTHLAVAMTAQDGAVLGYRVVVVADATTTRALPAPRGVAVDGATLQRASLAILGDRFADVMSTEQVCALPLRKNSVIALTSP